jgi:hypothetical protein
MMRYRTIAHPLWLRALFRWRLPSISTQTGEQAEAILHALPECSLALSFAREASPAPPPRPPRRVTQ